MTATPFADPALRSDEDIAYRAVVQGKEIGTGRYRLAVLPDKYAIRVQANGCVAGVTAAGEVDLLVARDGQKLLPLSYRADGRVDGAHGHSVGHDEGRLFGASALTWGGELGDYPPDILPALAVPLALRGKLEKGAKFDFPLYLVSMFYLPVHARVEGTEEVDVPAGRVNAWRVRFRPNLRMILGKLDKLVQPFVPPFYGYFAVDPPHTFVKLRFPTGPFPWNPCGFIEATSVQ